MMRRTVAFCCDSRTRAAAASVLIFACAAGIAASFSPTAGGWVVIGAAIASLLILLPGDAIGLRRQWRKTWAAWAAFSAARAPRYEGRHDGRG